MRWSRLRGLLEEIRAESLQLVIHCSAFRREDAAPVGRYWVELEGETIIEIPTNFRELMKSRTPNSDATVVTNIFRWWVQLPREEIRSATHPDDRWGLVDVRRVSDKRFGKRSLLELDGTKLSYPAQEVLRARLCKKTEI